MYKWKAPYAYKQITTGFDAEMRVSSQMRQIALNSDYVIIMRPVMVVTCYWTVCNETVWKLAFTQSIAQL
jgi:hypothetical protein